MYKYFMLLFCLIIDPSVKHGHYASYNKYSLIQARTVAMVIGQAFSAAYKQALKANGVTDEQLDQAEYTHILNAQSVPKIEIESLSDRSKIKKVKLCMACFYQKVQ